MSDLLYMYDHTNGGDMLKEFDILKRIKRENINNERCNLYRDFSINLTHLIYDTYLGEDYITTAYDIEGHYNWCFKKVCDIYYEQDFGFYNNDGIYEFFLEFFFENFYLNDKKKKLSFWIKYWNTLFDITSEEKEEKIMEHLVSIYKFFDLSLDEELLFCLD